MAASEAAETQRMLEWRYSGQRSATPLQGSKSATEGLRKCLSHENRMFMTALRSAAFLPRPRLLASPRSTAWLLLRWLLLCGVITIAATPVIAREQLRLKVIDSETKQPLAVRVHLKNSRGRAVRPRARQIVRHADHFVFDGEVSLTLRPGRYTFVMEAGPEYRHRFGHFEIEDDADDEKLIEMRRHADLREEGWYGGDMLVARSSATAPLLLHAEDLSVVPLLASKNIRGTFKQIQPPASPNAQLDDGCRIAGYLDHRAGGGLLFVNPAAPLSLKGLTHQDPSFVALQRGQATKSHVDAAVAFSWDLPLWLACGALDSFQLLGSHSLRDAVVDHEAWGRSRDRTLFPDDIGNGRWAEAIYYHILNAGIRLPPSAGSGSGETPNPPGQNRVYVHAGSSCPYDAWWEGLRAGRVFVTNGPLLRAAVEGHPPGAVFELQPGEERHFQITLRLSTRDPVDYLQVVKNGEVEHEVRLDQFAAQGGRLPETHFATSGWFLIRAVTNNTNVYQLASTGPYYVEREARPRISRRSVEFFLNWLEEIPHRNAYGESYREAQRFWSAQLKRANAP